MIQLVKQLKEDENDDVKYFVTAESDGHFRFHEHLIFYEKLYENVWII